MEVSFVFPHQLYAESPALEVGRAIYLIEDSLYFGTDRHWPLHFHKKKLILHRAGMKAYEQELRAAGHEVNYVDCLDEETLPEVLRRLFSTAPKVLHVCDPVDHILTRRLRTYAESESVELKLYATQNFLSPESWLDQVLVGKKPFMANFYKAQRKRMGILMEEDGISPVGGKWSFDEENRKKLAKKQQVPEPPAARTCEHVVEAVSYVNKKFPQAQGSAHGFVYPIDRKSARRWLKDFFTERFYLFGDYEDAISSEHRVLFHSVITPALNVGLLSPQEVIDYALKYAEDHSIPINTVEGFIRQIIGWREFMRAMYLQHGVVERNGNFWGFTREMPESFYTATTGVEPIDETIRRVLEDGYCHHVERLMLLGNFMLLCRIHPTAVYKWFMELFVDAYDWVMVPNVYGMSQFADGGIFTTKPYLSGSNYVRKMSDYKAGEWCEVWDGLFWTFIADYKEVFQGNQRLSRMVWMYEKMAVKKKDEHRSNADKFLGGL
jgi:deoxyribodipyrimidine photolyase-related protein